MKISQFFATALIICATVQATCDFECVSKQCSNPLLGPNCLKDNCGCPALSINMKWDHERCFQIVRQQCDASPIEKNSSRYNKCIYMLDNLLCSIGLNNLISTFNNQQYECMQAQSEQCWNIYLNGDLQGYIECASAIENLCPQSFATVTSTIYGLDNCIQNLDLCLNSFNFTANTECLQETVKECLNKDQFYSDVAEKLGCFKDELSQEECEDLYKLAISSGILQDKSILKQIHGDHKDTMKSLLINLAQKQELSQQDNLTNAVKAANYRGFDILDILQKKIFVNDTAFIEFYEDFYVLQREYKALRQQKSLEKQQFITQKYYETLGKVYTEFGKSVAPVVHSYADLLEKLVPNSNCNKRCLVDECLRPDNTTDRCINSCNCSFDEKAILKQYQNVTKEEEILHAKVIAHLEDIRKQIQVKEQAFRQKELQLTYKYYDFVEKHAIQIGGCDPVCVNNCTNPVVNNIHQVGRCLETCQCQGGAIKIFDSENQLPQYTILIQS